MFYYDSKIKEFEQALDYDALIKYLEEIICLNPNKIIPTIVGYSWYFCVEGDVNVFPKQYNYEKYLNVWKKYIDIGIDKYIENPVFDFIAGYSLCISGIYIDSRYGGYEQKGIELMNKCLEYSNGDTVGKLAQNFLLNEKSKKYKKLENGIVICKELFNNGSLLDLYFWEIYAKSN